MNYINLIDEFRPESKTAITLGKFDGVHVGHQILIHKVIEKKKEGFQSVLFTFDKALRTFWRGFEMSTLLTKEERRTIFNQYPLDYVLEYEFTKEFAKMGSVEFVEEILVKKLNVGYIAVGTDCTFGYKAQGDYKLLQELSKKYDFTVEVVEKVTYKDSEISSTRIRKCIEEGKIEEANHMLGYPFPIIGEVLHGNQLGRTLGIPTINMIPSDEKLLPPYGVYASRVIIDNQVYNAITNIGCKPTVSNDLMRGVETYILDYEGDLYGTTLEVDLYRFERPELKFSSIDELKEKMEDDIVLVKKYFIDNPL